MGFNLFLGEFDVYLSMGINFLLFRWGNWGLEKEKGVFKVIK